MRKLTNLAIAIGAGLCFGATAQADDLRFTTLPQTVRTTAMEFQIKCNLGYEVPGPASFTGAWTGNIRYGFWPSSTTIIT